MPPYCAAGFSGLLGRAAERLDINCVTLKGVSSPEVILGKNGIMRIGGALATSYRCVLLRPTHVHSASRGSVLQEARAGVTGSLSAADGPTITVTGPSNLSPGPCHFHSAHFSINKTTLQHQQLCNTGLYQHTGFHQHSPATHLHTLLSPKFTNEGKVR